MPEPLPLARLKAVIFDVDGTLYRQGPLRRAMALRLVRAHLLAPLRGLRALKMISAYRRAQEELRDAPAGSDLARLQLEQAAAICGLDAKAIALCVERWMDQAPLDLLPRFLQPGLHVFLRALKAQGLKLGVLSDYPAESKLRALGLDGLFEVSLCAQSRAIGVFKPHPRGLLHALERLEVGAGEALYVGDRAEVDAAAAAAARVACAILSSEPAAPGDGYTRFTSYAELHRAFELHAAGAPDLTAKVGLHERSQHRTPAQPAATLRGHLAIARVDHWFKNVFVLPGIVAAYGSDREHIPGGIWTRIALGFASICLVASSNYVINEVLDAPSDPAHPVKKNRPVPSGRVSVPLAYVQWIALMAIGVGLGFLISKPFGGTVLVLWIMGCVYNIPPLRSKDVPYIDVLSESVNNPLRMLAGWFMTSTAAIAPASLLLAYWMIGCYFMAIKRYAEFRDINDPPRAAAYRKSFGYYTLEKLMVSIVFYGSAAMLFLGAFIMRYRLELILSFPLVALVMAMYLSIAFKPDSAAQRPEGLYREPKLMSAVVACSVAMGILMIVDVPVLATIFTPTAPTIADRK